MSPTLEEEFEHLEKMNAAEARGLPILREMFAAIKNGHDSSVQTGQDVRSMPVRLTTSDRPYAACLRAPRGGKLRVVFVGSEEQKTLTAAGWEVAADLVLAGQCACGCGLPVPYDLSGVSPEMTRVSPLQKYADPEGCRRALYALQHPTLDLSGVSPIVAKNAARMAGEAVRAAKMGQARATVDAHSTVTHTTEDKRGPDKRPSCRLRLTAYHWELLGEIQKFWWRNGESGNEGGFSFSAIVMELIEAEAADVKARKRQEDERHANMQRRLEDKARERQEGEQQECPSPE